MGPQTIVSIAPFELKVDLPGRSPALFYLRPSTGEPVVGYVGDGTSVYYMDADRGSLMVMTPSETFVEEIIRSNRDTALLAMEGEGKPGVFAVEGRFRWPEDAAKVAYYERDDENVVLRTKTLRDLVDEAAKDQVKWYRKLVALADQLWSHPNGKRPNQISDLQRHAARRLGLIKEWLDKEIVVEAIRCKFCTAVVDGQAIVCPTCRNVLNTAAYKALTTEEKTDLPQVKDPPKPGASATV